MFVLATIWRRSRKQAVVWGTKLLHSRVCLVAAEQAPARLIHLNVLLLRPI